MNAKLIKTALLWFKSKVPADSSSIFGTYADNAPMNWAYGQYLQDHPVENYRGYPLDDLDYVEHEMNFEDDLDYALAHKRSYKKKYPWLEEFIKRKNEMEKTSSLIRAAIIKADLANTNNNSNNSALRRAYDKYSIKKKEV